MALQRIPESFSGILGSSKGFQEHSSVLRGFQGVLKVFQKVSKVFPVHARGSREFQEVSGMFQRD